MPQKTNLNINPYYDDFSKDKNFYKVLFRPGYPVQARELTTLQSSMQNQIESFGSHMFKEGSVVIPGGVSYDPDYYSIKLLDYHLGIPVSLYLSKLKGKRLKGQNSGVVISIDDYKTPSDSTDITDLTLFVKYVTSGDDNAGSSLEDGEQLITEESFVYGNVAVNAGDTVATLINLDASTTGCSCGISPGVYFIRGSFVDVQEDKIVLDPYTNTPSYRIGLTINEEIVGAKDDSTLYDNARGFSNYAAPGADRLKISTTLSKKVLTDYNDKNFIEILRLENGELKKVQNQSQYSLIKDYFAKRTFEESGNYSVGNFKVDVADSLNDGVYKEGVFRTTQQTDEGNTPNDDLMCVKVSSGKAYVKGYDIDKSTTTVVDVEKPRDKKKVDASLTSFELGSRLKVNNVFGVPRIAINQDNVVRLGDRRRDGAGTGGTVNAISGTQIGRARIYAFNPADAPYTGNVTSWDLYLYDIQLNTTLVLGNAIGTGEIPTGSYIQGLSSGASGYSHNIHDTTQVDLDQVTGTFITGEQISINGHINVSKSIQEIKSFGIQDVKSVYQDTSAVAGYTVDFLADTVLYDEVLPGFSSNDQFTIAAPVAATSLSRVTCTGKDFLKVKKNSIIKYQTTSSLNEPHYNRVVDIDQSGNFMTVTGVATVTGICTGGAPTSQTVIGLNLVLPSIKDNEESGLYTKLPDVNISNVDLGDSNLLITEQLTSQTTNSDGDMTFSISGSSGISTGFYEAFDAERYAVHYNNGTIEHLSADQFTVSSSGNAVTLKGLTASQSDVVVTTTLKKKGIQNKQKEYVRSQKVTVDSVIGAGTTITSGITTSNFYGMRVEDKEISLNVPDVAEIVAVYESIDKSAPTFDKVSFVSGLSLNTSSILGERLRGETTGAVAQLVTRSSATEVEIVYLNSERFQIGESITFEESNIVANLQDTTPGSYIDITNRYLLDSGQREQYYDYSRIVRKGGESPPARELTIVYNGYQVPSNDTGDVYTVDSYGEDRFGRDIPKIGVRGIRASDTLDFRPRVADFTSTTSSPFEFRSRNFATAGSNPTLIVSPNESSFVGYSFYLPRIDKLVLTPGHFSLGEFSLVKGISAIDPKEPSGSEDSMHIATIELPAYLYSPDDAVVTLVDNRRYTMRDIGKIEDRVENLETISSLSLLELDTKTLQVQDADGIDRFKSGFFADDFKTNSLLDRSNADCKADINSRTQELNTPINLFTLKPELALDSSINVDTADFSANLALLDSNIRKTGDLLTLDYEEVDWLNQPLASRIENVNPFNIVVFTGRVTLNPQSDNWVRNVVVPGVLSGTTIFGDREGTVTNEILVSSEPDEHIRSRNVAFNANGLKPFTRFYPFFDSTAGIDIVPKLVEIIMTRGNFTAGETVEAYAPGGRQVGSFRIAQPNHKSGDNNNPSATYGTNPYDRDVSVPVSYSASATILNIDLNSLADESQGRFWGYLPTGNDVILVGQTSNAEAKVDNLRLVTDAFGDVSGSFFFRDPNQTGVLKFKNGSKTFKITSSSTNALNVAGEVTITSAEARYTTSGVVDTYQQTTTFIQPLPPPPPPVIIIRNEIVERTTERIIERVEIRTRVRAPRRDPLAQTFRVDETGAFLTSVDVFFKKKDIQEKIIFEVRTTELGTPTEILVQNYATVTLEPSQVNVSDDASVATKVTFPSPIYLPADELYALVLIAPTTNNYEAWIAQMGEPAVSTSVLPDSENIIIGEQYLGGSLFKSQNGSIWTANQFEDLKFKLYKCQFRSEGDLTFYNPTLGNKSGLIPRLLPNAIKTLPRKLKVGITTMTNTTVMANLVPGVKVSDSTNTDAVHGYIERFGSRIAKTASGVTLTNTGSGYPSGTRNVDTFAITGNGSGATVRITVSAAGTITAATMDHAGITTGNGYCTGDLLGITTSSSGLGAGAEGTVTVSTINGIDTLYLTNCQGRQFSDGENLVWYSGSTPVSWGSTDIRGNSTLISDLYGGNVIEVSQFNHGLTSDNNHLSLADIEPDTEPVKLTGNIVGLATGSISVANTAPFATHEGISTSLGYLKVNNEIIKYDGIGAGTITIATDGRAVQDSLARSHNIGDVARRYELNGISLIGINTDHNMANNASTVNNAKNIDKYYLEVLRNGRIGLANRGETGVPNNDDNLVCFVDEKGVGGDNIYSSQNIQYNAIIPRINTLTPGSSTKISTQLRSVTGTSADGNETSFIDTGYEPVELNRLNQLTSTRVVCSEINEEKHLSSLPRSKSATLAMRFTSSDVNLSPIVDTQNAVIIFERNMLNKPINDYGVDPGANSLSGDPHAAIYISNKINLKQPATSLKILVSAYRHSSADFRVLYRLFSPGSQNVSSNYELFPGYDNLKDNDGDGFGDTVINAKRNSGRPDAIVGSNTENEFSEYQFTADNLEKFTGFVIKIVMSGTNEAYAPKLKDLRAIALA